MILCLFQTTSKLYSLLTVAHILTKMGLDAMVNICTKTQCLRLNKGPSCTGLKVHNRLSRHPSEFSLWLPTKTLRSIQDCNTPCFPFVNGRINFSIDVWFEASHNQVPVISLEQICDSLLFITKNISRHWQMVAIDTQNVMSHLLNTRKEMN